MPLPLSVPPARINPAAPVLPSLPPRFLLSLFTFAMLAKCFAGPHGSQIRPSKSDNAGSESTMARQLIPIVDCFKQKKKRQQNMDRGTERNKAGGRWGAVCMASYSYLALSPILTSSLACAWITDNECTTFSTGLNPFNVDPQLYLWSFFPLHVGY